MIKINAIANSSVFQIGSTGIIKPHSVMMNTGNFTTPAPPAIPPELYGDPNFQQVTVSSRKG